MPNHAEILLSTGGEVSDADFSGSDLRSLLGSPPEQPWVFRCCDFTQTDLRGASLGGAVFDRCTLTDARLARADLDSTSWSTGGAAGADFTDADCCDVGFDGVDLANTRWLGALLTDVSWTGCRLVGARLSGCRGLDYRFEGCNLTLARLEGVSLRGQQLAGLRLDEANLAGADLRDTTWRESRLRDAVLQDAEFGSADLRGADLRGADLGDLTLREAAPLAGAVISSEQATVLLATLNIQVSG